MTAEVIVVVENEDAGLFRGLLPVKVSSGQAADPTSDNHKVVALAGVDAGFRLQPIPQGVCILERSGMTAAHASQQRWVITGKILRRPISILGRVSLQQWPGQRCGGAYQRSLEEVASWDGPIFTELPIQGSPFGHEGSSRAPACHRTT